MIPGFVLAGGASRRMGRDKALLPIDGVPLGLRVARVLEAGGCKPVALVGNQPGLARLGLPVVREPETGDLHPLRGIAAALRSQEACDLALFCPCDLFAIEPEDIASLLAPGRPCVAEATGRLQPLLVVLPIEDAARIEQLARDGLSASRAMSPLPRIPLPDRVACNANRPRDLP